MDEEKPPSCTQGYLYRIICVLGALKYMVGLLHGVSGLGDVLASPLCLHGSRYGLQHNLYQAIRK